MTDDSGIGILFFKGTIAKIYDSFALNRPSNDRIKNEFVFRGKSLLLLKFFVLDNIWEFS